jgi:Kelch motif
MSRRGATAGLLASLALLLATIVVVTGIGPSVPGPPLREWLGVGGPSEPELCEPSPASVYDPPGRPAPGRWQAEPRAPVPSPEAAGVALGGYVYMVGGQARIGAEPLLLRFDPRSGEYRREPDAPVAIDHPVVAIHDGEIVLASGFVDGSDPTNRAWAYSPRTRRWRELASMRVARGGAAGAVAGDRLYVAGGTTDFGNENQPIRSLEIYDFSEDRWLRGPDMPTARHHHGAAAVGGKLYFVGGREPRNQAIDAVERFDPASGRWTSAPAVPTGTGAPGVAELDGTIFVTGGGKDPIYAGDEGGWVLRTTYAFDPATARWSRLPDMRQARHGHVAVATGGRLYVFRGTPCPGYGEMDSAESVGVG